MHTDGLFGKEFGWLEAKCRRAMEQADKTGGWNLLSCKSENASSRKRPRGELNLRTVEYHEYGRSGGLREEKHYDAGSLITMDIMLADPGVDFEGGSLVMPDPPKEPARDTTTAGEDGNWGGEPTVTIPEFQQGDAVLFVSHKYHNVTAVTSGRRRVLVLELWEGPERTCAHRCLCKCTVHPHHRVQNLSAMPSVCGLIA